MGRRTKYACTVFVEYSMGKNQRSLVVVYMSISKQLLENSITAETLQTAVRPKHNRLATFGSVNTPLEFLRAIGLKRQPRRPPILLSALLFHVSESLKETLSRWGLLGATGHKLPFFFFLRGKSK